MTRRRQRMLSADVSIRVSVCQYYALSQATVLIMLASIAVTCLVAQTAQAFELAEVLLFHAAIIFSITVVIDVLRSTVVVGFTAMWLVANELEDPFGAGAFIELEGQRPGDRRCGELDLQVVHVVPVLVADEQRVAEPGGRARGQREDALLRG